MSVYNLAFRAGIPLGALALGKLIPLVGVSKALAGSGVALTVISLVFLIARQDSAFRVEPQKGSNL
jgi:predicted MFS family arabinose efflux permease